MLAYACLLALAYAFNKFTIIIKYLQKVEAHKNTSELTFNATGQPNSYRLE